MHQNHYFLKHLSAELGSRLRGFMLMTCFSQNKDELVLGFSDQSTEFYIKADLSNQRGLLSFPKDFKRANKNSVDLFSEILDKPVIDVRCHKNERSFQISFQDNWILVFKLFGRQTNVLLFHNEKNTKLFKTKIANDGELQLNALDREIDQGKEAFIENNGDLRIVFPTFGPLLTSYLNGNGYMKKDIHEQWKMVDELLVELENPQFYIVSYDGKTRLSLVKMGETIAQYESAIEAITNFSFQYLKVNTLESEKRAIVKQLEHRITKTGNYIINAQSKIKTLASRRNDRIADIIMANLHVIQSGVSSVRLMDFYNNEMIDIKLNSKISSQKNAEKYYQKHKNQDLELRKINESMAAKQVQLDEAESLLGQVRTCEDLKILRGLIKSDQAETQQKQDFPYHKFQLNNYTVLVGKNAKSNDKLTQQFAHKDDLWFHARDVAGSHVVLKNQAGKPFSNDLIEKTAQIAAWYSKGKGFPLCPVIYTPKKYVRKPKGFAPGKVKVEREKVILVEPKNVVSDKN